ncbi:MAG: hypothetical protein N2483_09000, partial [Burkholderiaceae bacterium]|nr:hypothetical protein [Burkholderiaceae bacterium]
MTAFTDWLRRTRGLDFADYEALWRWSVEDLDGFWRAIWDYFDVLAAQPPARILTQARMPGAVWCPDVRLNLVDQVFRHATAARPAIVFRDEGGRRVELSWEELRAQLFGYEVAGFGLLTRALLFEGDLNALRHAKRWLGR